MKEGESTIKIALFPDEHSSPITREYRITYDVVDNIKVYHLPVNLECESINDLVETHTIMNNEII